MLHEYEAMRGGQSNSSVLSILGGREQALAIGDKVLTFCNCKNKGHKKSECRKRKADLTKFNEGGGERVHMACATAAVNALFDSRATGHILTDDKLLTEQSAVCPTVSTATYEKLIASGVGKCTVGLRMSTETVNLYLVLHVPEFSANLLSVSQLCQDGYVVVFYDRKVVIKYGDKVIRRGQAMTTPTSPHLFAWTVRGLRGPQMRRHWIFGTCVWATQTTTLSVE